MPLITALLSPALQPFSGQLETVIHTATLDALSSVFPPQLNIARDADDFGIAQNCVAEIAAGWIWVASRAFDPIIAGKALTVDQAAMLVEIRLLERALDDVYQNEIVSAIADAVRSKLKEKISPMPSLNLAIFLSDGDVQMSVPGKDDTLLNASAVHALLQDAIENKLRG